VEGHGPWLADANCRKARACRSEVTRPLSQPDGDHTAVLGSRVAASFGLRLRVQPLPFELPRYRSLVCWPARAAHDAGLRWLKDQLLAIAALG
jgi:hypothetical protein